MAGEDGNLDVPEDEVNVRFVIPTGHDEATVSEALAQAFEACREADMTPEWMEEERLEAIGPTKTVTFIMGELDVFVMDPFSGPGFEHLTSDDKFRCTVVGPRCLLACLRTNTPVPEMPYPLYTAAMRGLNVSFTGLDAEQKKKYKVLVERMSGVYSKNFHDGVTHLVAGSVVSEKYTVAIGKDIPVMTAQWVEEVWKSSCSTTAVTATEGRFSCHRCPALQGVVVSVSKMGREDKEMVRKAVTNHGGTYSPSLEKDQTTVLVTPSASGDKYLAARKWSIPCVTSSWVFQSIESSRCLPFSTFRLDLPAQTSSPSRQDASLAGLAEVSMCSTILNPDETMSTKSVEDTINCTTLESGLAAVCQDKSTSDWLAELELGKVKKAGTFLDGCKVFLSGFSEPDSVQLTRVLKFSGATRLAQLVESVSHVLHPVTAAMAADTARLLASLRLSPHHVSLEWVVESMRRGRPVSEADYPFPTRAGAREHEVTLVALDTEAPGVQDETGKFEAGLLAQYGGGGGEQTSTVMTENMSQVQPFLTGKTIELAGFPESKQHDLSEWINEAEGEIVYSDYEGRVDYLITPLQGRQGELRPHRNLVTDIWLEDCLDLGQLIRPPTYYHRPVLMPAGASPLQGVVTCLSGYSGREREFLTHLITALGGLAQEIFAKRDNPEKGARGNTHLVCPEGLGQKYEAAMKWRLPIVSRSWLAACHRDLAWVSERPFLVGGATAVTKGRPEPSEEPEEMEVGEEEEDTVTEDTNMSVDEVHRSYDKQPTPKTPVVPTPKTPSMATPLANLSMSSPATAVRPARTSLLTTTPAATDSPLPSGLLRPKPINLTDITVTPQRWADSQPSPSQRPPSSSKRKRAEGGMATPTTPYGCHVTPEPTPRTRKHYKALCAGMPRQELSALERRQMEEWQSFRPQDTPAVQEVASTPGHVRERRHQEAMDGLQARGLPVLERDDRPFEEIMEERYQAQGHSWKTFGQDAAARARARLQQMDEEVEAGDEADADFRMSAVRVLEGVTVCVAKKLAAQAKEVHQTVKQLGGAFTWQLDDSVTHFVFLGKQNDVTKEFRAAREAGSAVVAPDWVFMCRDEGRKVEEELFPHTFNPRMKLEVTGSSPSLSFSQARASSRSSRTRQKAPQLSQAPISGTESEGSAEKVSPVKEAEEEQERAQEVSANLAEMASLLDSVSKTPVPPSGRKVLRTRLSNNEGARRSGEVEEQEDTEEEVKESQVLWVDPEEELERRRLQDQVAALETQDLGMDSALPENLTALMEGAGDDKENQGGDRNTADMVFMVSGMTEAESASLEAAVAKLGGRVSSQQGQWDESASHMVTTKVSRSEKMLCSVAAGRWVLHPSYVTESVARGRWLEEGRFEWGDPENKFIDINPPLSTETRLAVAARRWRLQGKGCEAFAGMQMLLVMPQQKKEQFSRLVQAGGGGVVAGRPPYSNTGGVTHMLTEMRYLGKEKVDYSGLASKAVPVLKPLYLNDFLVSVEPPSLEDFMLEEFKQHWDKKKRARVVTDTPTNEKKRTKSALGAGH